MRPEVFRALIGLELRRGLAVYGRILALLVVAAVGMLAVGLLTAPRVGMLAGIAGMACVSHGPTSVVRDKLDGGLAFLVSLPVPPEHLVAGRFASLIVAAIPGALGATAMLRLTQPSLFVEGGFSLPLLGLGLFLALGVGSALAVACALRFAVHQVMTGFTILVVLGAVLDSVTGRFLPSAAVLRDLALQPWAPLAAWLVGAGALAGAAALAFCLARAGIRAYRPGQDRISW